MSRKIVSRPFRFPSEKINIKCEKSTKRIRPMRDDSLSVVAVWIHYYVGTVLSRFIQLGANMMFPDFLRFLMNKIIAKSLSAIVATVYLKRSPPWMINFISDGKLELFYFFII